MGWIKKKMGLLLVLGVFLASLWIGTEMTSTNRFCTSCHSMAPYAASLARDRAHRDMACVDCHLPSGFPSRFFAQVNLVIGDVLASLKNDENLRFAACVPD